MPEHRGRKRKPARTRRDDTTPRAALPATDGVTMQPPRSQTAAKDSIPALRARYAGFIVAVLTLMIGTFTLAQGVVGGNGTMSAALSIGAGVLLILIALVLGVLVLAPERVAAWLRRG